MDGLLCICAYIHTYNLPFIHSFIHSSMTNQEVAGAKAFGGLEDCV